MSENMVGLFGAAAEAVKLNAYVAKAYRGDYDRFVQEDNTSMVIEFLYGKIRKHKDSGNVAKAAYYYSMLIKKPFGLASEELKCYVHLEFKPWLKRELGMN